jgi:hypothetical protein
MANMDQTDLQKIALTLARNVVGPENVDRLEVEPSLSWAGDPSYRFHVFLDPAVSIDTRADLMLAMRLGLRDALDAQGDDHETFISLKDSKRERAEPSGA